MLRNKPWLFQTLLKKVGVLLLILTVLFAVGTKALWGQIGLNLWLNHQETDRIVFSSNRDGNYEIYVMNNDGSQQTRLTYTSKPDYGWIINQMTELLTNQLNLRKSYSATNSYPTWSVRGDRIAFISNRDDYGLYVMKEDGSEQTRLIPIETTNAELTWSPDGTKIVISEQSLSIIDVEKQVKTALGRSTSDDLDPDWSPDGQYIVFRSFDRHEREGLFYINQIYVMHSDGTNAIRLTHTGTHELEPTWSPDGTKIAFVSSRDGNDEIYIMDADGSNQTRLTFDPAQDISPTWSPDGTKIAFVSNRDGNNEIYVMRIDDFSITRLTNNPADDIQPNWRR